MLVVSNQVTLRIGTQVVLPWAREAEEDRHVVVLADVSRSVQGQSSLSWWQLRLGIMDIHIVHHSEHALLHLAGVLHATDDHLLVLEGHSDGSRRGHALCLPVAWEDPNIEDEERLAKAGADDFPMPCCLVGLLVVVQLYSVREVASSTFAMP